MHYTMQITQRLKKLIRSLHQKQFRDQNDLFVAEGARLTGELLRSDFIPELIVIKDSPSSDVLDVVDRFADKGVPVYTAPKHQFDQMCDTKTPQGVLAVVNKKDHEIIPDEPFIALDGISDPGNVGTIIRTTDWFGFRQVILGRDCADLYNPKVVRSTMGSIFRMKIVSKPEMADFLKGNFKKHKLYGADLGGDKPLKSCKPRGKFGLVFGSEASGISDELIKMLDHRFKIEGTGRSESLNVAVAVGITLYHFGADTK